MSWQTEQPIVHDTELNIPVLYPALGISLHLSALTPDDQPALERANALAMDLVGGRLEWTYNSAFPTMEPFRAEDLDYALGFTRLLDTRLDGLPPETHIGAINVRASLVQDFSVDCHGGKTSTHASPYQYRFFATIGDSPEPKERLPSRATLRITVPCTWPLDDFRARALELARTVPLRWGNAGLTYAGWEHNWYRQVGSGIFAHARRYPGFDCGKYASWMNEFHDGIRTVSWLTFVGPDLEKKLLTKAKAPASTDAVTVSREDKVLVLQAGAAPDPGDTNRLQVPRGYVQADAMLRPIRVAPPLNFHGAWDEQTTSDWLTRFERRWA